MLFGGRYSSPGVPVVSMASEAGLAVLVAMRYLPERQDDWPTDFVLGWTEVNSEPTVPDDQSSEEAIRQSVDQWLAKCATLLMQITSKVLPEADVVLLNPRHPAFPIVPPLNIRPFSFEQCLHRPPMVDVFSGKPELR
jgi:RES domain-containing protein